MAQKTKQNSKKATLEPLSLFYGLVCISQWYNVLSAKKKYRNNNNKVTLLFILSSTISINPRSKRTLCKKQQHT